MNGKKRRTGRPIVCGTDFSSTAAEATNIAAAMARRLGTELVLVHVEEFYGLEQTKNEGQVALEMGNSPKVVKDHYFEIVDENEAKEYWSIKPATDDRKIIAIASYDRAVLRIRPWCNR